MRWRLASAVEVGAAAAAGRAQQLRVVPPGCVRWRRATSWRTNCCRPCRVPPLHARSTTPCRRAQVSRFQRQQPRVAQHCLRCCRCLPACAWAPPHWCWYLPPRHTTACMTLPTCRAWHTRAYCWGLRWQQQRRLRRRRQGQGHPVAVAAAAAALRWWRRRCQRRLRWHQRVYRRRPRRLPLAATLLAAPADWACSRVLLLRRGVVGHPRYSPPHRRKLRAAGEGGEEKRAYRRRRRRRRRRR